MRTYRCGSGLARDANNSVHPVDRGAAIASKPAPTGDSRRVYASTLNPYSAAASCNHNHQ
ncbi:MAG TPA: hypothetical protein DD669_04710 [Pseudomonas sp.]|nr:hypothetical protein [Pseudomonas sp. TMW22080]HBP47124.1 hypothetical protein [Pseudomonas sp.]